MGTFSTNILPSNTGQDLGSPSQRWDAYLQNLDVVSFGGLVHADQFTGADAGAKIIAALLTVPNGGIVDARGFGYGVQSISSTIAISSGQVLILNPATAYRPSTSSVSMFTVAPSAALVGLTADISQQATYSGTVVALTGDHRDGQRTRLEDINIAASGVTTGKGISVVSASSAQAVSFVTLNNIRVVGLARGIYLGSSGSGAFVNGNHFQNVEISDSVYGLEFNIASSGVVNGNIFSNFSYQAGAHTTAAILCTGSSGGVMENTFSPIFVWDTTTSVDFTSTNAQRNLFIGGMNGTFIDGASANNYIDVVNNSAKFSSVIPSFPGGISGNTSFTGSVTANGYITALSGLKPSGGGPVIGGDGVNALISAASIAALGATTPGTGAFTTLSAGSAKTTLDANGLVTKYNNVATVSGGMPSESATVDLTAQGAAIVATTAYTPAANTLCRVSWAATITRAGSVSSTLGGATSFQLKYTDPDDSVVKTTAAPVVNSAANTTGTSISGTLVAYCKAATALQYIFGYTDGGGTTMQYNLHARVESL